MGQDAAGDQVVSVKNLGSVTVSENVAQWNGTTVDTNSGVKSAGTVRVVLATDQPALTAALKVDGSAVNQPTLETGGSFLNIAGAATTVVKSGAGTFVRIVINKPVASSTITIYDNTAASGTKIATITHPATLVAETEELDYGVAFATGLTVVTSGADDITVVYR